MIDVEEAGLAFQNCSDNQKRGEEILCHFRFHGGRSRIERWMRGVGLEDRSFVCSISSHQSFSVFLGPAPFHWLVEVGGKGHLLWNYHQTRLTPPQPPLPSTLTSFIIFRFKLRKEHSIFKIQIQWQHCLGFTLSVKFFARKKSIKLLSGEPFIGFDLSLGIECSGWKE